MKTLELRLVVDNQDHLITFDTSTFCPKSLRRFSAAITEYTSHKIPRPYILTVAKSTLDDSVLFFDAIAFSRTSEKERSYKWVRYVEFKTIDTATVMTDDGETNAVANATFAHASPMKANVLTARKKLICKYLESGNSAKALQLLEMTINEEFDDTDCLAQAGELLLLGAKDIQKNEVLGAQYIKLALHNDPQHAGARKFESLADEYSSSEEDDTQSIASEKAEKAALVKAGPVAAPPKVPAEPKPSVSNSPTSEPPLSETQKIPSNEPKAIPVLKRCMSAPPFMKKLAPITSAFIKKIPNKPSASQ